MLCHEILKQYFQFLWWIVGTQKRQKTVCEYQFFMLRWYSESQKTYFEYRIFQEKCMSKKFIGRTKEISILNDLMKKPSSSLVVVRGRRRIGKSTLIKQFAKNYTFFGFEGLTPTSKTTLKDELDEFARQLSKQTGLPEISTDDWSKLFQLLWEKSQKGKVVILFDEISWMGSKDHLFLSKIKLAWDNYFSQNPNLMLVICGSASSWIEENILSSTGFVGRISHTLTLKELEISHAYEFWNDKKISRYEILKTLSVIGCVPKYLEEIDPQKTSEENIKKLCFTEGGFLVDEFEKIFSDLFLHNSKLYREIVESLAQGPKTMSEIAKGTKFSRSGKLSKYLAELELGGFIELKHSWDFKTTRDNKTGIYRLKDNYLRFYVKYIAPNSSKIKQDSYSFKGLTNLTEWQSIMGLQFENLVIGNRKLVIKHLGLSNSDILADNPYLQKTNKNQQGCQIDYLIQDKFNTFYICEIKFSRNPIGKSVIKEVQSKIDKLKTPKYMSFRPVLIHLGEVTEDLKNSGYFYKIIDFSELN